MCKSKRITRQYRKWLVICIIEIHSFHSLDKLLVKAQDGGQRKWPFWMRSCLEAPYSIIIMGFFFMSSCADIACPLKRNRHIKLCSWSTQTQTQNHYSSFRNSESFNYSCSVSSESVILQGTIRLNAESQIVFLTIFHDLIQSLFVFPSNTFWLNMWNLCWLINYRKRDVMDKIKTCTGKMELKHENLQH